MNADRSAKPGGDQGGMLSTQRIDKWLWYARFFKTRGLATTLANSGKVRITVGEETVRVEKASQTVRVGTILTFPQGPHIRVIKVLDTGTRRGPAPEARLLYEDMAPIEKPQKPAATEPATVAARKTGTGRPTKRDRRAIDAIRSRDKS